MECPKTIANFIDRQKTGERGSKGYTVLVVPIVLKKAGIVKGEGSHRKYTEETFVEELRNARFQYLNVQANT